MTDIALSHYSDHRDQHFSGLLTISDWYALFPEEPGYPVTVHKWPANFPNAGKPGVYLIFDMSKRLLYIGMTTVDVNRRLGSYFGYVSGRGSGCKIKNMQPPWKARPALVRTIAVNNPQEAPILERFLIETLKPRENSK